MWKRMTETEFAALKPDHEVVLVSRVGGTWHEFTTTATVKSRTASTVTVISSANDREYRVRQNGRKDFLAMLTPELVAMFTRRDQEARVRSFLAQIEHHVPKLSQRVLNRLDAAREVYESENAKSKSTT